MPDQPSANWDLVNDHEFVPLTGHPEYPYCALAGGNLVSGICGLTRNHPAHIQPNVGGYEHLRESALEEDARAQAGLPASVGARRHLADVYPTRQFEATEDPLPCPLHCGVEGLNDGQAMVNHLRDDHHLFGEQAAARREYVLHALGDCILETAKVRNAQRALDAKIDEIYNLLK